MISKRSIISENDGLLDLKALVEAYEEIAAAQMQRVRRSVLQSREFMEGVTQIFTKVRRSYDKEIERMQKSGKKKIDEFSVLPRNGKSAIVFVSANSGLFGDIVKRTFSLFLEYVKQKDPQQTDVVIVGKLGLRMLGDSEANILYNYFDFPDDWVDYESINMMMRYLLQHEQILVFHGQFKSLVYQEPVSTGVSGHDLVLTQAPAFEEKTSYLFEPSLKEVLQIFEGEILSSIFAQAMHESQLAKFASRMFNLDRSMENIENRLKNLSDLQRRLEHHTAAKKQLGRIAGMTLWS
jgi:ATP synthase F1 gamma subunit